MKARSIRVARAVFFVAAFLSGGVSAFADSGVLIPREVFIGDTAEFSFSTDAFNSALEADSVFVVPSADLPVAKDVTVESIAIARRAESSTVTIRFVPWKSGVIKLPSIAFKKFSVEPPPLRIGSIVEKTGHNALEPPRPPLLVPGTTFLLYALVAVLVAILAILVFAGVRIRRFLSDVSHGWTAKRRARILNRELDILLRMSRKRDRASWYADFSAVVRRYLGEVVADDPSGFLALTVSEIAEAVDSAPFFAGTLSEDVRESLRSFLSRLDVIRYSGHDDGDTRADDILALRSLVASLEDAVAKYVAPREEARDA